MINHLGRVLLVFQVLFSVRLFEYNDYRTSVIAKDAFQDLQEPLRPDFVPTEKQREDFKNQGGNDLVHEVWSVLREDDSLIKQDVTAARPSALLDSIWYYTKWTFRTLFMNAPKQNTSKDESILEDAASLPPAIEALKTAAAFDDHDAIFLLAEMNLHGNFSHPRIPREALKWYSRLAQLNGNSTAQYMLGLLYSTGIGNIPRNPAKSLMYHKFAAEQDNVRSEMTLAFKYHSGIGSSKDCDIAVAYYKKVADKAMNYWNSGPPGGLALTRNSYRWVEVDGGAYGEGASASSSGHNAPGPGVTTSNFDDMLEYMDMRERQGDYNAILTLGMYYYEAPRGYKRNLRRARQKFMKIAKMYWTKDGKINPKAPKGIDKLAGKAAAYIGRLFLRGEGVEQSFENALIWFKRGVSQGNNFSQYHLGLMYRDGLGVPKDGGRAGTLLKEAAEQVPLAQSALGVLFLDQGDLDTARKYFELAAAAGVMEGVYYLAEMSNNGVGRDRNCGLAALYYKVVVEKAESLHSSILEANAAYEKGDLERAFIPSLMAAEQGYENAQANVAYLLDQKQSAIKLPEIPGISSSASKSRRSNLLQNSELALAYYTRSANQANVDSLVKAGDYYISGDGIEDQKPDLEKAITCYSSASEGHRSAQALWNLGWMHENGVGSVPQDFHLAKRYYDLAYELNKEAYLPVKLALGKLRLRSWWNEISGGSINSIRDEDQEDEEGDENTSSRRKRRPKSLSEWITRFLEEAQEMDNAEYQQQQQREAENDDLDLYAATEPGMPGGDSDYASTGSGSGSSDTNDDTPDVYGGGGEWDDFDDGLVESLIIIALAGALAMLVYARQARQRRIEVDQGQVRQQGGIMGMNPNPPNNNVAAQPQPQPQPQPQAQPQPQPQPQQQQADQRDRGLFPQPGDPELNNWVVGGVGH